MKKCRCLIVVGILLTMSAGIGISGYGKTTQGVWKTVPLVSNQNREVGSQGGEGGQWPHALEVGKKDSSLIFYGTNTGGIYRSVDGGKSWTPSSRGMLARGSNAFAIDPCADQYIIATGISDGNDNTQGIYLSSDRGGSWQRVLDLPIAGNKVYIDGLEYDESSFDRKKGRCMRAYYSTVYEAGSSIYMNSSQKGLYRTEDGGYSWTLVNADMTDAKIKVNPSNGRIFAARSDGIYVSNNYGKDFSKIYQGNVSGFDVSWKNNRIYICSGNGVMEADAFGLKFQQISGASFPSGTNTSGISVSPVNPNRMVIQSKQGSMHSIYYSADRGQSWQLWNYDGSKDFFPYMSFEKVFAWSYQEEGFVWSFGGENVIASKDGGANWEWSSEGICGVLCGGKFHFNIFDPQVMFFGAQDFNGAITTDGGATWKYTDVSGNGGWGHVYGGYAASARVFWGCLADSWSSPGQVTISFDGGISYVRTGNYISKSIPNAEVSSYQAYNDPQVFFAGNYRSSDGGRSWSPMDGCLQVYTHNPQGAHELYGCEERKGYVVVSYDNGRTWNRVNQIEIPLTNRNHLSDIQVDGKKGVLYVAANGCELYRVDIQTGDIVNLTDRLLKDELGNVRVSGIAVDPGRNLLYVAGHSSTYNRKNSLQVSADGGESWSDAAPIGENNGQVVVSAICPVINSTTGELWSSTACHGFVKLTGR